MRTLIDVPDGDLQVLNRLSREASVSRAELVRRAIRAYLEEHGVSDRRAAFGSWKGDPEDGLAYQERLRSEW